MKDVQIYYSLYSHYSARIERKIYRSHYWVTQVSNKTCSNGNDLSNVFTAGNSDFYGGPAEELQARESKERKL
jgi:hypothetical protein